MKNFRTLLLTTLFTVITFCCATPTTVSAKSITVDPTLAVSPIFTVSGYAMLNPQTAAACNNDVTKMYNYYMSKGAKEGQRLFATPVPTTYEELFLYMSNNRKLYTKQGLSGSFPYFNVANYIAANPDLVPVYGTDLQMYLYHYINFGIYEGRSSGTVFDPARAIEFNSPVAAFNNPSLSPDKIYTNYIAATGSMTTVNLVTKLSNGSLIAAIPTPAPQVQISYGCSSHDWEDIDLPDEGKHKKRCKRCCTVEGIYEHNYETISQYCGNKDYSKHKVKCYSCGHVADEAHKDVNKDGKCDVCNYTIGTKHTHSYAVLSTGWTDSTHKLKCSCGSETTGSHDLKYSSSPSPSAAGHTLKCECGYSKVVEHTFSSSSSCTVCGYSETPSHTHSFTSYLSNSNGTHTATCSGEDCSETDTQSCNTSGVDGACSVCNYKATPSHTHSFTSYSSNSNGTHTATCSGESCSETDTQSCNTSGVDGACSVCNYKSSSETT